MTRARPISPPALAAYLAELALARRPSGPALRLAVDGAPATDPGGLADRVVAAVREVGRPAVRVSADGFLRPASLRLEHGRRDPDARYEDWLDERGLRREVLDPLGPGGSGHYLPALWDAARDRATRLPRVPAAAGTVVVVDGELLLGRGLPFDLTVHLALSPAALARRTPVDEAWALPAYQRYEREVGPTAEADVVVRVEDPRHPALLVG